MIRQRCVRRSSVAPVRRSEPSTSVQDSKGRFVVTIRLVRSYAVEMTSKSNSESGRVAQPGGELSVGADVPVVQRAAGGRGEPNGQVQGIDGCFVVPERL